MGHMSRMGERQERPLKGIAHTLSFNLMDEDAYSLTVSFWAGTAAYFVKSVSTAEEITDSVWRHACPDFAQALWRRPSLSQSQDW